MKEKNIAGLKVDFFGSDKQEMMKLYEDILVDANQYVLQVEINDSNNTSGS